MDGQEETSASDKKIEETTLTETKRISRNINEKKRRDRFNILISELAAVISPANRNGKYEKMSVLKDAIACLRNQRDLSSHRNHGVTQPQNNWQTTLVGGSELSQIIVEAMNGFVLSLDCSGIISFASDSILSALGYRSMEMIDNSIADFLDQTDRSSIFTYLSLLQKQENALPSATQLKGKSTAIGKTIAFQMNLIYGPHFGKNGFVTAKCCGQSFTVSRIPVMQVNENTQTTKLQLIVVGSLQLPKPNIMVPISNIKAKEFTSRLTLDWKYTFVDTRVLPIVGYLPCELIEKSAYLFLHEDDLENVSSYHQMLVRKGRVNTCYYRFLTKGQTWVWLRSCCYVSYNQWNSKPEYVTSTTNAVNYEEVCANQQNLLKEDRLKFLNIYKSESGPKKGVSNQVTPCTSSSTQDQSRETLQYSSPPADTKVVKNSYDSTDKLPLMDILKSSMPLQDEDQEPMDEDIGVDVESISSETSELNFIALSTMKAPDGLTPAQCKLHLQLQGKHKALENSIKHQINELERIKKQIEINKQLWEFNKQLQEKKGSGGIDGLKNIGVPRKRRDKSEGSSSVDSNYEPVNKSLHTSCCSEEITGPYSLEVPVSHYIDIPPLNLGDPPLYGIDQQSSGDTPFTNALPPSSLSFSFNQYHSQNRS